MPPFLLPLRERAAAFAGLAPERLAHALITEYRPGTTIGWHRDRPHYDDVIGISLLSPCTFRMRRKRGTGWERAALRLDCRSVYLFAGRRARTGSADPRGGGTALFGDVPVVAGCRCAIVNVARMSDAICGMNP